MSRTARLIVAGYPHHIVHRGHNRQAIFRDEYNLEKFRKLVMHYLSIFECELMAYAFMRNHIHMLVLPGNRTALVELMHGIAFRYAQYFNQTSDRKAHSGKAAIIHRLSSMKIISGVPQNISA